MNSDNSLFPARLGYIHDDISHLNLANKVITIKLTNELTKLLNEAQPRSEDEIFLRRAVVELCNFDRRKSFKFLLEKNPSFNPLLLWTNARAITKYFHLYGKVYITWNRDELRYEATPFVSGKEKRVPNKEPKLDNDLKELESAK